MDRQIFEKTIKIELKNLTKEQTIHFAWLCGVRALPFLGCNRNFDYLTGTVRQRHLYSIFYALDFNKANTASAIFPAFSTSTIAKTNAIQAAFAASTAAFAYTDASSAEDCALAAAFAVDSVTDAAFAADSFTAAAKAATAAAKNNIDLEIILLSDLEKIKQDGGNYNVRTTDLYGVIWDNFQNALEAEGCGYWGKLYQTIFDNGFALDQEALQRRMTVPKEIQDQGAAAVANYLEELEKGAERLNEARIIILGDKGVGKTSLARRLVDPNAPMTSAHQSTAGVDTTLWKLREENINVHIWDFAGHVVTHAVHQFFLSERCLYVIVYDGRTEERNRLDYWLDHMKNFGSDSKAIILVNKRDQHNVDIPINSLKEQYPIEGFYTFSIQDDKEDLEVFRNNVAGFIKNNPSWNKLEIPANYFQVKEELENIFVKGEKNKCKEHISKKEFDKIAKNKGIGNIDELLSGLHALGVSLWYKDMEEFNTLILNPEWISFGVYKIINWVNQEKKYSLTLSDFVQVFIEDVNRYPLENHQFFFNLMIKYELAYQTDKGNCLIIPHLLKEDRPSSLPEFPIRDSLMLRYKVEQPLPPNTISRFIVRHNQEIKKSGNAYLVWRYGVVLDDGKGTVSLVREENRTISVSVKGENKTEYISTLRETLNDIFNSYKSKKPELQYLIERFGQIPDEVETRNPLWLSDKKVLTHALENVPYYDDSIRQPIDLHYTVNNYNITAQTLISGQGNHYSDLSIHNTFNFQKCNIGLQGSLKDLALSLTEAGNPKDAKELEIAVKALNDAKQCKNQEEVSENGVSRRLKRITDEFNDENSTLHKTVKGIKYGVGIAQDIAKGYNDIAQWLGLPPVPKPFLKKE